MFSLIFLGILVIILCLWLRKLLSSGLKNREKKYQSVEADYNKALAQDSELKENNMKLERIAQETIALYNITKDICRSLDQDKVFDNFSSHVNRYIKTGECKFLRKDTDLSVLGLETILPLNIDKDLVGYLALGKIDESDKEKFHILSQQFLLGIKRAILYKRVQDLAITDSLTEVFSRRYLLERLEEEIQRSGKLNYNFCFLMADIDNFKAYNDRYGHLVGDAVLREVAGALKENVRQVDLVGRYGGEEFSIILTETDHNQALIIAERIRQAIEAREIKVYDELLRSTISIGISVFPVSAKDVLGLIDTADQALYKAKQTGRNKICLYE